jgi:hypothetical protein
MGTVSFDVGPIIDHKPAPGSVYRSPQIYEKLRPEMDADNSSADAVCFIYLSSYYVIWKVESLQYVMFDIAWIVNQNQSVI